MQLRREDHRGLGDIMFDLSYSRRRGHVIKNNQHTVIVEFVVGCNKKIRIKRHKRKHNIKTVATQTALNVRTFLAISENKHNKDVMWESGGAYVENYIEQGGQYNVES
jgi:hypothetical protein